MLADLTKFSAVSPLAGWRARSESMETAGELDRLLVISSGIRLPSLFGVPGNALLERDPSRSNDSLPYHKIFFPQLNLHG